MPRYLTSGVYVALLWLLIAPSAAQTLDLPAVLERAAKNSPELRSAYAQVKVAEAGIKEAKLLENPQLSAEVKWPNDSSPAAQEYSLSYNIIDLFNRGGRVRTAELRREAALQKTLTRAVEIEAAIKAAFYTVQGHAQALEEQKILLQVAQLQSELAQRQRDAGNIPELVLAQYQAMLLQARTQFYDRQMALFEARQELARLMGEAQQAEQIVIAAQLPDLPAAGEQTAPELLAEAISARPDLAEIGYEVEALQAERGQQSLLTFDGTSLGYVYERETSLETLQGVSLSMPLPIFDRRQGEKARLDAEIERGQAERDALFQNVTTEVKTLLVKMANARLRVEQLEQLVPLRQRILELSRQQYNAMLVGTYQLLDTRGDRSTAVLTLADAKADYWRARTDLERALGRSILKQGVPFSSQENKP